MIGAEYLLHVMRGRTMKCFSIVSAWRPQRGPFGLLAVILICSLGCGGSGGPERANVTGQVTFDGQPVEKGVIAFVPDGSTVGPTSGAIIENGRYRTQSGGGPVLGSHRVEIVAHRPGKKIEVAGIGGAATGPSASGATQETEMYIPAEYNANSMLTVNIKSGTNTHDFALQPKPQ